MKRTNRLAQTLAFLLLATAPVRADLPADVDVKIGGGSRIAIPERGPDRLLVPLEIGATLQERSRIVEAGVSVEAFEVRKIPRERDPGFTYPKVEGSAFRIENLSPMRLTLKRGVRQAVRFQIVVPRTVAPGIYWFRARIGEGDQTSSSFFEVEIVRGTPNVDYAPVEIGEVVEEGTPEAVHPIKFPIKVENDGEHAWGTDVVARVRIQGEGEEIVEREVKVGIVPPKTRVTVEVELQVLAPRTIEVVVDPADVLPESDEANGTKTMDVPGQ